MKSLILLTFLVKTIYTSEAMAVNEDHDSYSDRDRGSDSFIFPDEPDEISSRIHEHKVRDLLSTDRNCMEGFCEDVQDYPEDLVKRLINKNEEYHTFFNIPPPKVAMKSFGMEELCSSIVNTTYPRVAVNTKNERVLLASVGDFRQVVQAELCNFADGPCIYSELLPPIYQTRCEQRHTILALLTVVGDKLKIDTFRAPSCCVCMYKTA